MRVLLALTAWLLLTAALSAQPEPSSVVDLFLRCPDVGTRSQEGQKGVEVALGDPHDRDPARRDRDSAFRQRLLVKGEAAPGVRVTSVVIDPRNGYLRVDGVHEGLHPPYPFRLVFVYFENARKDKIPALSFHYEAMEEDDDFHRFYAGAGDWRVVPDRELFDAVSEKPLVPYLGAGDTSNVTWALELPQYGTTVRFLPRQASLDGVSESDAYLTRLEPYALEYPWIPAEARFGPVQPARADQTDVPGGKAGAADFYPLLHPGDEARRLRDRWKASPHPADFFEARGDPDHGNSGTWLKVLGRYRGLPLVAEVDWEEQTYDFSLWLYHAEGLMEPSHLLQVTGKDFYAPARQAQVPPSWTMGHMSDVYTLDAYKPGVSVILDTWHNPDLQDFLPDYDIELVWDNAQQTFTKVLTPARNEKPAAAAAACLG